MLDITHTPDGDIELGTGDMAYSESTNQHKRDIVLADKGHYKEVPEAGVGAANFVHDTNPENLLRSIRKEFTKDGMKVKNIGIIRGQIINDAEYENSNR